MEYIVYISVEDLSELMTSTKKLYEDAAYFKTVRLSHESFLGFDGIPENKQNFKLLNMFTNYMTKSPFFINLKIKSQAGFALHLKLSWSKCLDAVFGSALLESAKARGDGRGLRRPQGQEKLSCVHHALRFAMICASRTWYVHLNA